MNDKYIIPFLALLIAINPIFHIGALITGSSSEGQKNSKVWICTGSSAYAYHSRRNCSGLNSCKGSIRQVTLDEAVKKYHRKPCKKCW